jgi:hypothetical protein
MTDYDSFLTTLNLWKINLPDELDQIPYGVIVFSCLNSLERTPSITAMK